MTENAEKIVNTEKSAAGADSCAGLPAISIIVPVYKVPEQYLRKWRVEHTALYYSFRKYSSMESRPLRKYRRNNYSVLQNGTQNCRLENLCNDIG